MMGDVGSFGSWGPGFGLVFMIVFWALIILGIAAIVKWLMGTAGNRSTSAPRTGRQILEERYARGDIDREEFEQKKNDLEQ
jgi:putative membrane protein